MKRTVLATVFLFSSAMLHAAPAPVDDLTGIPLEQRLERLERIAQAKQKAEFAMQNQVDALQREVLELRGLIEQQEFQISQMLQRQRQLYEELDRIGSQATQASNQTQSNNTFAPSTSLGETASYENAVNLVLKQRQYDEAIPAFQSFIQQYPKSGYAANANYWLGQLLYNKNELKDSEKAFLNVVNQFPDSNKRADSLVKLGLIAEKQNQLNDARKYYQWVLRDYANSSAARIASQQMSGI